MYTLRGCRLIYLLVIWDRDEETGAQCVLYAGEGTLEQLSPYVTAWARPEHRVQWSRVVS